MSKDFLNAMYTVIMLAISSRFYKSKFKKSQLYSLELNLKHLLSGTMVSGIEHFDEEEKYRFQNKNAICLLPSSTIPKSKKIALSSFLQIHGLLL